MTETIRKIAVAAVAAEKATGCPAELMVSQCALESAWLKEAPGNNCFGIKEFPGCFGRQLLHTTEWFTFEEVTHFLGGALATQYGCANGRTAVMAHPEAAAIHSGRREYKVQDWFATFETLADCFAKRAQMFAGGRYAVSATKFKVDRDFEALVRELAPIYATDPHYADTVLEIARQLNVRDALAEARKDIV